MDTGSALGTSGLVLSFIGILYSAINHKQIRSKCCGRVMEVSIDIDTTVPQRVEVKPEVKPVKVASR